MRSRQSRSSTTTYRSDQCLTLPPHVDLRGEDGPMQDKMLIRRRAIARQWIEERKPDHG